MTVILCGVKSTVTQPPPTFLFAAFCGECDEVHEWSCCPKCGGWLYYGFGIAAGGYGSYAMCEEMCGWSIMEREVEE